MARGAEQRPSESEADESAAVRRPNAPAADDVGDEPSPSSAAAVELQAGAPWARWINYAMGLLAIFVAAPVVGFQFGNPALAVWAAFAVIFASFLVALTIVTGHLLKTRVLVGSDGVLFSWMGVNKFVPYSELDLVIPVGGSSADDRVGRFPDDAVELHYRDGSKYRFGVKRSDQEKIADAISRRLDAYQRREAAEGAEAGGEHAALEAARRQLQRKDRPVEEWLAALQGKAADPYRGTLQRDQLWEVLRDPSSPNTARAAAAKLLRCRVEDRDEIRVIAEATAQPRMRVALETAASEEEEEAALLEAVADVRD
ncbi:MAG: CvpA family protein [Deltaproteobacteria bacterium]|jgi:hypothetical protein|nr:CvpA family protein [Deltaproteobacteria bacterium]MBW2530664.1 CvpA family protein [Deltaproteobacteria bacterium]